MLHIKPSYRPHCNTKRCTCRRGDLFIHRRHTCRKSNGSELALAFLLPLAKNWWRWLLLGFVIAAAAMIICTQVTSENTATPQTCKNSTYLDCDSNHRERYPLCDRTQTKCARKASVPSPLIARTNTIAQHIHDHSVKLRFSSRRRSGSESKRAAASSSSGSCDWGSSRRLSRPRAAILKE